MGTSEKKLILRTPAVDDVNDEPRASSPILNHPPLKGTQTALGKKTADDNLSGISSTKSDISSTGILAETEVFPEPSLLTSKEIEPKILLDKLQKTLQSVKIKQCDTAPLSEKGSVFNTEIFNKVIFKKLVYEQQLLKCCKRIGKILEIKLESNSDYYNVISPSSSEESSSKTSLGIDANDNNFTTSWSKDVLLESNCTDNEDPLQPSLAYNKSLDLNFSSGSDYTSFDQNCKDDDGDTLSIFAESLTGLESFSMSSDNHCDTSEPYYVPQPLKSRVDNPLSYIPSKIPDIVPIAEKVSEIEIASGKQSPQVEADSTLPLTATKEKVANMADEQKPVMMNELFKPVRGVKSVVLKDVCFYNLISNCMKVNCAFPHNELTNMEIMNRLTRVNEKSFIREYMLLRNWPDIRRKYGLIYVHECINRKLTSILVEMCIDFIAKAKSNFLDDAALKEHVIEKTLLYLNNIDDKDYEFLLTHDFGNNTILCDIFINTIATTQNFSRFKLVFAKLVTFMDKIGREFQVEAAKNILERVCILPYEEQLALAVLTIIRNVRAEIFDFPMMPKFKAQLMYFNSVLYNDFCTFEEQREKENVASSHNKQSLGNEKEKQQAENRSTLFKEELVMQTQSEPQTTYNKLFKFDAMKQMPDVTFPPPYISPTQFTMPPPKIPQANQQFTMPPPKRPQPNQFRGPQQKARSQYLHPRVVQRNVYRAKDRNMPWRPRADFY